MMFETSKHVPKTEKRCCVFENNRFICANKTILIIKVNKLFSFFSAWCFLKEIENMYSVFLSSYTNTRESLGELEKAVETLACGSCSHSISHSPKLPLVFV